MTRKLPNKEFWTLSVELQPILTERPFFRQYCMIQITVLFYVRAPQTLVFWVFESTLVCFGWQIGPKNNQASRRWGICSHWKSLKIFSGATPQDDRCGLVWQWSHPNIFILNKSLVTPNFIICWLYSNQR